MCLLLTSTCASDSSTKVKISFRTLPPTSGSVPPAALARPYGSSGLTRLLLNLADRLLGSPRSLCPLARHALPAHPVLQLGVPEVANIPNLSTGLAYLLIAGHQTFGGVLDLFDDCMRTGVE